MPEFLKVNDRSPRIAEVCSTLARLGLLPNWESSAAEEGSPQWSGDDDLFNEDMYNALLAFQQPRSVCTGGTIRNSVPRLLREVSYTLGTRALSYNPLSQMTGKDVGVLQTAL